jgi:Family of unknown function (DUF5994)
MTTTTGLSQPLQQSETMPGYLSLKAACDRGTGWVDGAWWPRSHELADELSVLIGELDQCWGRVTRVTVNPALWTAIPRTVNAHGHTTHVGWFREEQNAYVICLLSYGINRMDLLVIPPESSKDLAHQLMVAASDPSDTRRPEQLLSVEAPHIR